MFNFRNAKISFTDKLIDFADKLAISISLALENSKIFAIEQNIADTLQEALLILPERIPGIDYGHLYRSATETSRVGGDFYDLFELEHGKVGVLLGDVSGKGLEAATLTSLVKNTTKAYAYQETLPSSVVAKTNDAIKKATGKSFITLFFGVLDLNSRSLTYCCAGHPPGIIKRKTSEIELLNVRSPVAGAFVGLDYIDGEAPFYDGDTLILYTDGVIEARRDDGFYGIERLEGFIKSLKSMSVIETPERIFDNIMGYSRGKLSDDLALLALRIKDG